MNRRSEQPQDSIGRWLVRLGIFVGACGVCACSRGGADRSRDGGDEAPVARRDAEVSALDAGGEGDAIDAGADGSALQDARSEEPIDGAVDGSDGSEGSPDADASVDVPDGGQQRGSGYLQLLQSTTGATTTTTLTALFLEELATSEAAPCAAMTFGACRRSECDGGGGRAEISAGAITATGGPLPTAGLTTTPDSAAAEMLYAPASATTSPFDGETISFTATGDTIPAFSRSISAPVAVTLSPLPASASKSSDLTVSWTPPADAQGHVIVTLYDPVIRSAWLCQFPVNDGSGVIMSSVLQSFTGSTADALMRSRSAVLVDVGAYRLSLNVYGPLSRQMIALN